MKDKRVASIEKSELENAEGVCSRVAIALSSVEMGLREMGVDASLRSEEVDEGLKIFIEVDPQAKTEDGSSAVVLMKNVSPEKINAVEVLLGAK